MNMRDALRHLFRTHWNAVAFTTVLQEMPDDLRAWVLAPAHAMESSAPSASATIQV